MMMKLLRVPVLISACLLFSLAARGESTLEFKTHGFTIDSLEGKPGAAPHQALMMFLPTRVGFSPNVNVQIQPFDQSLEDYVSISHQQFEAAGFKVIREDVTEDAVTWEYAGTMRGRGLHWYARAIQQGDRVYLVTATAAEEEWDRVADQLKSCVDSFSLTAE